jgi:hypothetical protein
MIFKRNEMIELLHKARKYRYMNSWNKELSEIAKIECRR